MNNVKTIKELSSNARGQLIGKYGISAVVILLSGLIQLISLSIVDKISGGIVNYTPLGILIGGIINLLFGLFSFGICRFFLNLSRCKEPLSVGELFFGFKFATDKIILIQSLHTILFVVTDFIDYLSVKGILHLKGSLFIGRTYVGTLLTVLFTILLDLLILPAFYLLNDHPEYSFKEILFESFRLMKGNRLKLVLIYITTLPLRIVSSFAFGIGIFWFTAFFETLLANFYLNLIGEEPGNPVKEPEPAEEHTLYNLPK